MGKIVSVTSQKGGTGKSTSVFHLGLALQKLGLNVAILDTDPRQATLLSYHGSRCINANRKEFAEFDLSYPDVAVLKSDSPYRKTLQSIRDGYDIALLDTKGEFERFQLDLIRESDYVIIPIGASQTDLNHSEIVVEAIKDENVNREDDEKVGYSYLLQKVRPTSNSFKHFYRVTSEKHHVMSYMPFHDAVPSITPYGLTTFDVLNNMSAVRRFVKEDWEGDNPPSFTKSEIELINQLMMDAATSLIERMKL